MFVGFMTSAMNEVWPAVRHVVLDINVLLTFTIVLCMHACVHTYMHIADMEYGSGVISSRHACPWLILYSQVLVHAHMHCTAMRSHANSDVGMRGYSYNWRMMSAGTHKFMADRSQSVGTVIWKYGGHALTGWWQIVHGSIHVSSQLYWILVMCSCTCRRQRCQAWCNPHQMGTAPHHHPAIMRVSGIHQNVQI